MQYAVNCTSLFQFIVILKKNFLSLWNMQVKSVKEFQFLADLSTKQVVAINKI